MGRPLPPAARTTQRFTVRRLIEGWVIDGASRMGPYPTQAKALEIAEGIVDIVRDNGAWGEVVLDQRLPPELS